MLASLAAICLAYQGEPLDTGSQEARRVYQALMGRVRRIRTLSMVVLHGNFADAQSPPRKVHFPPPPHPRADDPKSPADCFNLWLDRWDRVSHVKFHGQKATLLEHIPTDGGDGYGRLYVSELTGWPLAMGYAPDRITPHVAEFTHLRITLKRRS